MSLEPKARRGGKVLVVDDDATVLFVVSEHLRVAGFDVASAPDASNALTLLHASRFDVIVSDISMPDMTGVEFLARVRNTDRDTPFILLTGRPTIDTAIQAVEFGALHYLQKPISSAVLVEAVEGAVRVSRLARWKNEALAYLGAEHRLGNDPDSLEGLLTAALEGLWIAYQPIVHGVDGRLFGCEALVRSAAGAMATPGPLFDAAERLGRVHALGRRIRALIAAWDWPPGAAVFVNLHALELTDEELYSTSGPLVGRSRSVVLEITERHALDAVPDLAARIRSLRGLGYRIAIDDLGAGYSSLASFAALEPDIVKLEMAIVRGVDRDPYRAKLISSVTAMCRDLGILVVAEGVETTQERAALLALGCELLQGNLIAPPAAPPLTIGRS